jgi:hypothetical protein
MRIIPLSVVIACVATACAGPYKAALCNLSNGSTQVATHYAEYVSADTDADRKTARQAEAKQFQQTIEEGKLQCAQ